MSREELIEKMDEAVKKMKAETNKGVIKEYAINSVVNWQIGKDTGQAAVLTCGTKFEYTEDVLKRWKDELGASEYRIKVNRSQLFITFIVYYEND